MEKKFGTRDPREIIKKLDGFSKPYPKDVPKEKYTSCCGVLLSIVLYVTLAGFAYFAYSMLEDADTDLADLPVADDLAEAEQALVEEDEEVEEAVDELLDEIIIDPFPPIEINYFERIQPGYSFDIENLTDVLTDASMLKDLILAFAVVDRGDDEFNEIDPDVG